MPKIEVTLPDRVESEITRLVEQGDFLNRDQAVEELLSLGVSSYEAKEDPGGQEVDEELVSQLVDDQQDPALQEEQDPDDQFF